MKALIVDDEQHVRDAVRLLVDWAAFGIGIVMEADNGDTAAELIASEHPDLVFTDMMMPGKSGTQLLEWIERHAPDVKTVVISGHDDFDFVRKTVKHGGVDYILKPIDPQQLGEAVAKALALRREEEQNRSKSIELNQLKPVYWDKMLTNLIDDPSYFHAIEANLRAEFGLQPSRRTCRIAVLTTHTMSRALRDKFGGSEDLLHFSVLNICNEFLRRDKQGIAFRYVHSAHDITLFVWRRPENAEALLAGINDGCAAALRSRFEFGLGREKPLPDGIRESFREAQAALRGRNLLLARRDVHVFTGQDPRPAGLHLTDYEEPLLLAIRSGSGEQIRLAVRQWTLQVRKLEHIHMEQVELWRHEYSVIKARLLKELFGADAPDIRQPSEFAPLLVPLDNEGRLSLDLWEEELAAVASGISQLWMERKKQDEHVIFDIAKFVETNYAQDITLQDIAERFFLSREYISRKFKQQFGVNLSDYLERIRIDKAKLLLLNPQLRISQIADMVGYQDEKYFSKVFKKIEGVSPGAYRKG